MESEEQLFTLTVEQALALLAAPKTRGRRSTAPLKELGEDPMTGRPVVIKDGRFGPYITDGETNVSLRRGMTVENVDLGQASQLLMEKRSQDPAPRKRATKAAAKTAKKTAAKKTTAKKAAAKKATGGKSED